VDVIPVAQSAGSASEGAVVRIVISEQLFLKGGNQKVPGPFFHRQTV
jgi:hypothetical protein